MAEKRMFSKKIVESDAFLDMPLSSQALYFHLCMGADDDGFLNAPKRIMRMLGCTKEDLEILNKNRFILFFSTGIVVIKHWRINNNIQKDRYKATQYIDEMSQLKVKENNAYTWLNPKAYDTVDTDCIQDGYSLDTQIRLDKNSIDKSSIEKKRGGFIKPTVDEIKAYVIEKGYHLDPEAFFSFYESNGWKVGKNSMKSWKDACTTWEKREGSSATKSNKLSDISNGQVTPLSPEERQRLKEAIRR